RKDRARPSFFVFFGSGGGAGKRAAGHRDPLDRMQGTHDAPFSASSNNLGLPPRPPCILENALPTQPPPLPHLRPGMDGFPPCGLDSGTLLSMLGRTHGGLLQEATKERDHATSVTPRDRLVQ